MTLPFTAPAHALQVSACAAERRDRAAAFLASLPREAPVLMLVPTPNAGLWLMPGVLQPGEARFDWRRMSLEQHCRALARPLLLSTGKSCVTPVAAQALCTRVMHELARRGELGRFAAVSSHPGFGRALWSTISELRMARLSPDALAAHDPDLARILAAFEEALTAQGVIDLAELYALAAQRAQTQRIAALLALDIPITHAVEAELVRAMAAHCERACVTIPLGDPQTLEAFRSAFTEADETLAPPRTQGELARLQARLFERDLAATTQTTAPRTNTERGASLTNAQRTASPANADRTASLANPDRTASPANADRTASLANPDRTASLADPDRTASLANPDRTASLANADSGAPLGAADGGGPQLAAPARHAPLLAADGESPGESGVVAAAGRAVQFLSSPGESRECVEVARAVLDAARSGVAFDQMAILVRAVDNYRSFLEEALSRAQIPAHFAAGVRRPAPEGRAFALLLRCADSGLSLRRFAEYLSLGVMPRAADAEAAPVSPRYWERLLMQAQVGGQSAHWRRQLAQLSARWREQLVAADDVDREATERKLTALDALIAFALPVLERIEGLPERARFGEFREQLSALADQALHEAGAVQTLLAELSPLDHTELGRRELFQLLAPHLHSLIVPSEGSGAGKLQVLPIEEARGRSFERVFVVGLAEKLMPPRLREDPLLPDALRALVSPALSRMPERVARERLMLRVAVGAASEQLCLSFPRFDAEQGRPRVPSFYGLEILEAVEGRLPAWSELGERASHGAAARLGWPAPEDPARAIDDAEYDLAVIARTQGDVNASTGALRYLVSTNAHLARALRFRARRWELPKFVAADGFVVSDDAAREQLREYLLAHRYSPSALEQLAVCPYRFYLRSVVRVVGPEESESIAALDPRERGVLFHKLLHDTLTALAIDAPDTQGTPPRALDMEAAHAALEQALSQLQAERSARDPQRARLIELELRSLRADLQGFLREQAQSADWAPRASELGFGQADTVTVAGLPLSGAIDLVEQHTKTLSDKPLLRATDFKTGSMHSALERGRGNRRSITAGGQVLQPLLYALALEQLFPEAQVSAGRLYYCTRQEQYESHVVELNERTRELAARLAQYANDMLTQGFLPAAPEPADVCSRCEYQVICGPHEAERVRNVKQRDAGRLRSLNLLRGLP